MAICEEDLSSGTLDVFQHAPCVIKQGIVDAGAFSSGLKQCGKHFFSTPAG